MRQIPALTARDVGADPGVVRPQRIRFFARDILHDRKRFPELEIAVDQSWRAAGRIDGEKGRRARAAFGEVDQLEFQRHAEIVGERANLPGIR